MTKPTQLTPDQCIQKLIRALDDPTWDTDTDNISLLIEEVWHSLINRTADGGYGLAQEFAIRFLIASVVTTCSTGWEPHITSGYRSPAKQKRLQNQWDAGNRDGLVVRPASRSWHMQGLAADVWLQGVDPNAFNLFRSLMLALGCRWGGYFKTPDAVHFDFPVGEALSIEQLLV